MPIGSAAAGPATARLCLDAHGRHRAHLPPSLPDFSHKIRACSGRNSSGLARAHRDAGRCCRCLAAENENRGSPAPSATRLTIAPPSINQMLSGPRLNLRPCKRDRGPTEPKSAPKPGFGASARRTRPLLALRASGNCDIPRGVSRNGPSDMNMCELV